MQKAIDSLITFGIILGVIVVFVGGFIMLVIVIPVALTLIVSLFSHNELVQVIVVLCYYIPMFCYFTRTDEREFYLHL